MRKINIKDKDIIIMDGYKFIVLEPDEKIEINGKVYKGNKFGKKRPIMIE